MNVLTFTGNLGKDCEVRFTQDGKAVCGFSVAVKSGYGDKAKTTWIKCTLWGKRAEGALKDYLVKGAQVAISGEFSLQEWEKDGVKHSMPSVNVDSLDLIGGKPIDAVAPKPTQQAVQAGQAVPEPAGFDDFDSDTIPF